MAKRAILLTEILLQNKIINQGQLEKALEVQKERKDRIGRILLDLGYVQEKDIAMSLAQQFGLAYVSLAHCKISERVRRSFAGYFASKYCVIPIDLQGDLLTIAVADPTDLTAVEFIAALTQCQVMTVVATETDIRELIARYYGEGDIITALGNALVEHGKISSEELNFRLRKLPSETQDVFNLFPDVDEDELYQIFSKLIGIPFYDLRGKSLSPETMELISPYTAIKYAVLPLEKTAQRITVALANPLDIDAVETALTLSTTGLRILLGSRHQIMEAISRHYQVEKVPEEEKVTEVENLPEVKKVFPPISTPPLLEKEPEVISPPEKETVLPEVSVAKEPPLTPELTLAVEEGTLEEILIRREKISLGEWAEIKNQLQKSGGSLEDLLLERGLINEEELAKILEEELDINYINALEYEVNPWALGTVPVGIIQKYCVFPLDKLGKSITLAVVNPLNQQVQAGIKDIVKYKVNFVISTRSQLQTLINNYFPTTT